MIFWFILKPRLDWLHIYINIYINIYCNQNISRLRSGISWVPGSYVSELVTPRCGEGLQPAYRTSMWQCLYIYVYIINYMYIYILYTYYIIIYICKYRYEIIYEIIYEIVHEDGSCHLWDDDSTWRAYQFYCEIPDLIVFFKGKLLNPTIRLWVSCNISLEPTKSWNSTSHVTVIPNFR